MFEGITIRQGAAAPVHPASAGRPLCALSWAELAVRLDAARDLRRILVAGTCRAGGSFDLESARHMSMFGEGKPAVNPIALANGKMAQAMGVDMKNSEMTGDRGR